MEIEKPAPKKEEALKAPIKQLEMSNNDTAWICEFCNCHNKIRIEKE
jgi:hypothetical protein